MKGDRRKPNRATMREQTRGMLAAMSNQEVADAALLNSQNFSIDPELRRSIAAELREEVARRKAAQEAA